MEKTLQEEKTAFADKEGSWETLGEHGTSSKKPSVQAKLKEWVGDLPNTLPWQERYFLSSGRGHAACGPTKGRNPSRSSESSNPNH